MIRGPTTRRFSVCIVLAACGTSWQSSGSVVFWPLGIPAPMQLIEAVVGGILVRIMTRLAWPILDEDPVKPWKGSTARRKP